VAEGKVEVGPFAKTITLGCSDVVYLMDPTSAVGLYADVGAEILEVTLGLVEAGLSHDEIRNSFRIDQGVLMYEAAASERKAGIQHANGTRRIYAWPIFWDAVGHPDDEAGREDD